MPTYLGRRARNRKTPGATPRVVESPIEADYDADAYDHFRNLWKLDPGERQLPLSCQVLRLTRYSDLHPEMVTGGPWTVDSERKEAA